MTVADRWLPCHGQVTVRRGGPDGHRRASVQGPSPVGGTTAGTVISAGVRVAG